MNGSWWGWALVTAQGALFAAIVAWPAQWGPSVGGSRVGGAILVGLAVAGVVAAAWFLGRALTPLPESNGAGLAAHGVYRWVRHPMYTAVLLGAVGVAMWRGELMVWVWTLVLGVLFEAKSRYEERHLVATYAGYAEYAARTGKFLPGVAPRR